MRMKTRIWNALGEARVVARRAVRARRRFPSRECLIAVTALELRGVVECALTGEIRRR